MPITDLELILDQSDWTIRQLLVPRHRATGFKRPRYLEYADDAKTRVRPITCPHDGQACTHVVLLPEVAASGYGVLCPHCLRTPNTTGSWPRTKFPADYLGQWTVAPDKGSIMDHCGTHPSPTPATGRTRAS